MTPEELHKIAEAERQAQARYQHKVHVCIAAGCLSAQSDQVKEALRREMQESGMHGDTLVKGVGCMGLCSAGPLVSVDGESTLWSNVKPDDAGEILRSIDVGQTPTGAGHCSTEIPFFSRQQKIVLENSGKEVLREVFGSFPSVSSSPDERIHGKPIRGTQRVQSLRGTARVSARSRYHGPRRGGEPAGRTLDRLLPRDHREAPTCSRIIQ